MSYPSWPPESPIPVGPALPREEIHVWCASFAEPPLLREQLLAVLSVEERALAYQHACQRDRSWRVASRGLLRWLLGTYLNIEPARVPLRVGLRGKPELVQAGVGHPLFFNVSHAEDIGLYALSSQV